MALQATVTVLQPTVRISLPAPNNVLASGRGSLCLRHVAFAEPGILLQIYSYSYLKSHSHTLSGFVAVVALFIQQRIVSF